MQRSNDWWRLLPGIGFSCRKCSAKNHSETKHFNTMMGAGKISSAIGLLAESHPRGVFSLSDKVDGKSVEDILKAKCPNPFPSNWNYISNPSNRTIPCHASIYEQTSVSHIRTPAHGSHGPSGVDANKWRRTITLSKDASCNLSKTIAKVARRIATEAIAPE